MKDRVFKKALVFYVLTFVFTVILAMAQELFNIDYSYITLPQWGPGIAALVLSFAIFKNAINKSVPFSGLSPVNFLICLLLPFGMIGAGYFFSKTLNLSSVNIIKIDTQMIYIVITSSFFGAIGEALGWRCFLQKILDDRFNYLTGSVIVGILWGLWHVGHYSNGLIFMLLFLIFTISASIVLSYLIRQFNYNLLLAAIFHLSINMGFYVFYKENTNDVNMMLINALVWLSGAIVILASKLITVKRVI